MNHSSNNKNMASHVDKPQSNIKATNELEPGVTVFLQTS